jgi:hypothetical protein
MNFGRRTHPQFDDDVVPSLIKHSQYSVAFMFCHKFCEKHTKSVCHIDTLNVEFISVASRSMSDNHCALHRATPDGPTDRLIQLNDRPQLQSRESDVSESIRASTLHRMNSRLPGRPDNVARIARRILHHPSSIRHPTFDIRFRAFEP